MGWRLFFWNRGGWAGVYLGGVGGFGGWVGKRRLLLWSRRGPGPFSAGVFLWSKGNAEAILWSNETPGPKLAVVLSAFRQKTTTRKAAAKKVASKGMGCLGLLFGWLSGEKHPILGDPKLWNQNGKGFVLVFSRSLRTSQAENRLLVARAAFWFPFNTKQGVPPNAADK